MTTKEFTQTISDAMQRSGIAGHMLQTLTEAQRQNSMPKPLGERKLRSYGLSKEWMNRNPTFDTLCQNYSPAYWNVVAKLGDAVYDKNSPALIALNDIYRSGTASRSWLEIQVMAYTTSINERDPSALDMIPIFVTNFAQDIRSFKLLEIMLFFSRLVAGHYKTYGRFEPKQIAEAWKLFLKEREREIDNLWQRRAMQEREKLHKPNPNNLSLEEWKTFKPFMEAGYDLAFYRSFSHWLRRWKWGCFRASSREPHSETAS